MYVESNKVAAVFFSVSNLYILHNSDISSFPVVDPNYYNFCIWPLPIVFVLQA